MLNRSWFCIGAVKKKKTRGKVFLYYGVSSFVFFIVFMVSLGTYGASLPDPTPSEVAAAQAEQKAKKEEKAKKEAEEKAEKEAKEKAKKEAKEKAKQEEKEAAENAKAKEKAEEAVTEKEKAESKVRKEAEEKAKKEAKEKAKREEKEAAENAKANEKAEKEAQAKKAAVEKAEKEAQAKKEAAENAALAEEKFKTSAVEIDYIELARDPDSFIGTKVLLHAKVMQNLEDGKKLTLLLNVTDVGYGIWDDTILVNYTMTEKDKRILEDDIIFLWGTVKGLRTYGSILGERITVPEVDGAYVDILWNDK
ncbi:hypothetical protein QNH10_19630 [Sporosarcina thermotolerans]|uniref:hypothetical protein n=1 Tax=Sporosarcina thermotolerans TaxID=633404 RepID=UPI0024BC7002|nr:hypothetical protein [Sporosarcina thermotolerans]WHT48199.1 hypothetical protein QNH10_19630 [Sporosarcina thermotolerans]